MNRNELKEQLFKEMRGQLDLVKQVTNPNVHGGILTTKKHDLSPYEIQILEKNLKFWVEDIDEDTLVGTNEIICALTELNVRLKGVFDLVYVLYFTRNGEFHNEYYGKLSEETPPPKHLNCLRLVVWENKGKVDNDKYKRILYPDKTGN